MAAIGLDHPADVGLVVRNDTDRNSYVDLVRAGHGQRFELPAGQARDFLVAAGPVEIWFGYGVTHELVDLEGGAE